MESLIDTIKNKSSGLTAKVAANLISSVAIKGINILISFITVPLTLNYLDNTRYGVWMALSSFVSWFFIFDIGIGHGLRNKLIELKARSDIRGMREYVSTSYMLFIILAIIVFLTFFGVSQFVSWDRVLNTPKRIAGELERVVVIVFFTMCITFVLKLLNSVLHSLFKNALCDAIGLISHMLIFVGIFLLTRFSVPSLERFALMYVGINTTVWTVASILLYLTILKDYRPSLGFVRLHHRRALLNTGFMFFLVQIFELLLFQTTSFILINLTNPETVTIYSINQKYFMLGSVLFTMMSQPLWTGFGIAYNENKIVWIETTIKRLKYLWFFMVALMLLLVLIQPFVFKVWLSNRVKVDLALSILFVAYLVTNMWNGIFNPFVNSTSKLKPQLILLSVTLPIFALLIYLLIYINHLGAYGMLISIIVAQAIPMSILLTVQSKKLLIGLKNEQCLTKFK